MEEFENHKLEISLLFLYFEKRVENCEKFPKALRLLISALRKVFYKFHRIDYCTNLIILISFHNCQEIISRE